MAKLQRPITAQPQFGVIDLPQEGECPASDQGTNQSAYLSWDWTAQNENIANIVGSAYGQTVEFEGMGLGTGTFYASAGVNDDNFCSAEGEMNVLPSCPSSVALGGTTIESLANIFPGSLTGIGIVATMQVSGGLSNYAGAQIEESLSTNSNSCPANFGNPCAGGSTFTVGNAAQSIDGTIFPAATNVYYDQHATTASVSLLNQDGITTCATSCHQTYSCNGTVIGQFTINKTFSKGTLGGQPVTNVIVTKF